MMTGYDRFELVMWSDDYDLNAYGLSREKYTDILKRVYAVLDNENTGKE